MPNSGDKRDSPSACRNLPTTFRSQGPRRTIVRNLSARFPWWPPDLTARVSAKARTALWKPFSQVSNGPKSREQVTEVSNWERAARLRAYADLVEQREKAQAPISGEVEAWLAWARAKADWLDPLVLVSDPILDAPEPKRPPGYW